MGALVAQIHTTTSGAQQWKYAQAGEHELRYYTTIPPPALELLTDSITFFKRFNPSTTASVSSFVKPVLYLLWSFYNIIDNLRKYNTIAAFSCGSNQVKHAYGIGRYEKRPH